MLHMGHAHGVYIQAAITQRRDTTTSSWRPRASRCTPRSRRPSTKLESRGVFGSDYPFHDYPVELQKVYVAGLTEAQKELVLYANAKSLLL